MNMKKQLFYLSTLLFCGAAPMSAQDITHDGIVYTVIDGTNVEVKGFADDTSDQNPEIPSTFTSDDNIKYTVTAIGDGAFKFANLKSCKLPETVQTIGNNAFAYNMFLRECNLPDSLKSVGDNAFQRCFSCTFTLPTAITHFGEGAFWECSKIAEVTIPLGAEVGTNAFMYCTGVKKLSLEGAPAEVGDNAFAFTNLEELIVKSETPPAFVPEDVFAYGDNADMNHEWTLDLASVPLKVPEGATHSYQTDRNWSIFTNITEINQSAISEFTDGAYTYKVLADGTVAVKAFDGTETTCTIPESVSYNGTTYTVTAIDDNAFANSVITSMAMPGTVSTIGDNAFLNCSSLTDLSLGTGIKSIGKHAFDGTAITSLLLPEGIDEIDQFAFRLCASLTNVYLPAGVTVAKYAFFGCPLTTVKLGGAPKDIANYSMFSANLKQIECLTEEVPQIAPAAIWLYNGEDQFNDQVVLFVKDDEMAGKFKSDANWDVFKAILPVGSTFDESAAYMPENVKTTLDDIVTSTGLKAFVPETNTMRMLICSGMPYMSMGKSTHSLGLT